MDESKPVVEIQISLKMTRGNSHFTRRSHLTNSQRKATVKKYIRRQNVGEDFLWTSQEAGRRQQSKNHTSQSNAFPFQIEELNKRPLAAIQVCISDTWSVGV